MRCGAKKNAYKALVGKLEEKKTTWITLKWMLMKWNGNILTEFAWLRTGTSVVH
jgi:hypothetical protein